MKIIDNIKRAFQILKSAGLSEFFKAFERYINRKLYPYRPDETKIAYEALKANEDRGLMFDVGAHYGDSLAPFARSGWTVYAFEPDSENRKVLSESFNDLKNVMIDKRAVSNKVEMNAVLYRSEESTGISSLSSFHPSHEAGENVDVITLEAFLSEQGLEDQNIDFLKIDTEGFDLKILQGIPWSRISPRLILCEFEDKKTIPLGYTFYDLADYLVDHGYKLLVSEWRPIKRYGDLHNWRRFAPYPCRLKNPRAWGNILATKEETLYSTLIHLCDKSLSN